MSFCKPNYDVQFNYYEKDGLKYEKERIECSSNKSHCTSINCFTDSRATLQIRPLIIIKLIPHVN